MTDALLLRCCLLLAAFLAMPGTAHAEGDAARGEKYFEECIACHALERGANSVGPSLYGVFERKAGTLADFRFSPALKRSGVTWTAATLDAFIADPQQTVPGNRMPYAGMPDAGARADLITYLLQAFR
jgi:cytochrome c